MKVIEKDTEEKAMKENEINKLNDDELEGVSGGLFTINNTLYSKGDGKGIFTSEKDETMNGKVTLLNGMTKSGKNNAEIELLRNGKVTNA